MSEHAQDAVTTDEAAGLAASSGAEASSSDAAEAPEPSAPEPAKPSIRAMTVDSVNGLRRGVKVAALNTKLVRLQVAQAQHEHATDDPQTLVHDDAEFYANMMLAYRHLEDASMRLGKAIQAADGGISVYDRETTVGA